jgi:hypothetical protein
MKRPKVRDLSVDQLVEQFIAIGVAQDEALLHDNTGMFNRLYDRKTVIVDELRARPGDQRRLLVPLYEHPNMQVRLNAAKATLAISPAAARKALEAIWATRWQPQAGSAGMSLRALDEGIFKPT